jgi:hypothetical protein
MGVTSVVTKAMLRLKRDNMLAESDQPTLIHQPISMI